MIKAMTLRMPVDMHRAANQAAAGSGIVLTVWIRRAIAEKIERDRKQAAR